MGRMLMKYVWWNKGSTSVEVLRSGHFPSTAMVKLPNDKQIEVEISELEPLKDTYKPQGQVDED